MVGRYDILAFPAYALLVGLAFAKLQSFGKAGHAVLLMAVIALGVPIGTKLARYYSPPSGQFHETFSGARTAEVLASRVLNGDVVVFTQLRGLPVLYYLHRVGFEWVTGKCLDPKSGKSFGCRLFPPEMEAHPATYDISQAESAPSAARDSAASLIQGLQGPDNSLWVVFGAFGGTAEELIVPYPDIDLIDTLATMGFGWNVDAELSAKGIIRMQRRQ